jgi:hypothetical protein
MAPEMIDRQSLAPYMESDQQQTTRPEDARHLAEYLWQCCSRQIHDGVEGDDPRKGTVGEIKSQHVAQTERDLWVKLTGLLDHARGEVYTEDIYAGVMKVPRDLTRTTAQITSLTLAFDFGCEAGEQCAIGRFVLQLGGEPICVISGEPVVAFPDCLKRLG